jgi:hypothetical protein
MAFDVRADRGSHGPRLAGLPKFAGLTAIHRLKYKAWNLRTGKELRERVSGLGRLFRLAGAFAIARV